MKSTLAFVLILCLASLCSSIPLKSEESDPEEDPCLEKKFGKIPVCKSDDESCNKRRLELCEKFPKCYKCDNDEDNDEADETEPIIVAPGNSTDPDEVEPEIVAPLGFDDDDQAPDELRKPQSKLIERNIIIENDNETQYYRGFIESGANITTVIRLVNLINNTNIVNIPTTLNNTNINNIHVFQNKTSKTGGKFGLGYNEEGPCCYVVGPKSCKTSSTGPKCHHKRHRVCGKMCTKKVIHEKKNPCNYSPQWPFVTCKDQQFPPQQGFYNPPMYGFYPPQVFYPPPQGFYPPPNYYPEQQPPFIEETHDDDDIPEFPDDDLLENPEGGWIIGGEKCKVISEDGLQIINCTNGGAEFNHPYARNSASEVFKRQTRHAAYPTQFKNYQNYPANYPIYQPIYLQPMPMFVPQYYYPQPNFYQPQQNQIPLPPTDPYYNFDQEESEIESHQPRKLRVKKHQPIIMYAEDEL